MTDQMAGAPMGRGPAERDYDDVCWMDLNGWGGDDSPEEKRAECRRLRVAEIGPDQHGGLVFPSCSVHGPASPPTFSRQSGEPLSAHVCDECGADRSLHRDGGMVYGHICPGDSVTDPVIQSLSDGD